MSRQNQSQNKPRTTNVIKQARPSLHLHQTTNTTTPHRNPQPQRSHKHLTQPATQRRQNQTHHTYQHNPPMQRRQTHSHQRQNSPRVKPSTHPTSQLPQPNTPPTQHPNISNQAITHLTRMPKAHQAHQLRRSPPTTLLKKHTSQTHSQQHTTPLQQNTHNLPKRTHNRQQDQLTSRQQPFRTHTTISHKYNQIPTPFLHSHQNPQTQLLHSKNLQPTVRKNQQEPHQHLLKRIRHQPQTRIHTHKPNPTQSQLTHRNHRHLNPHLHPHTLIPTNVPTFPRHQPTILHQPSPNHVNPTHLISQNTLQLLPQPTKLNSTHPTTTNPTNSPNSPPHRQLQIHQNSLRPELTTQNSTPRQEKSRQITIHLSPSHLPRQATQSNRHSPQLTNTTQLSNLQNTNNQRRRQPQKGLTPNTNTLHQTQSTIPLLHTRTLTKVRNQHTRLHTNTSQHPHQNNQHHQHQLHNQAPVTTHPNQLLQQSRNNRHTIPTNPPQLNLRHIPPSSRLKMQKFLPSQRTPPRQAQHSRPTQRSSPSPPPTTNQRQPINKIIRHQKHQAKPTPIRHQPFNHLHQPHRKPQTSPNQLRHMRITTLPLNLQHSTSPTPPLTLTRPTKNTCQKPTLPLPSQLIQLIHKHTTSHLRTTHSHISTQPTNTPQNLRPTTTTIPNPNPQLLRHTNTIQSRPMPHTNTILIKQRTTNHNHRRKPITHSHAQNPRKPHSHQTSIRTSNRRPPATLPPQHLRNNPQKSPTHTHATTNSHQHTNQMQRRLTQNRPLSNSPHNPITTLPINHHIRLNLNLHQQAHHNNPTIHKQKHRPNPPTNKSHLVPTHLTLNTLTILLLTNYIRLPAQPRKTNLT